MIVPGNSLRIFVATKPVDFRKGMDGLAAVVEQELRLDPFCGAAFVFRAKRADRLKILLWDGSGYWLLYKRIEHGRFRVFDRATNQRGAFELSSTELALLLDGIDLRGARRRRTHDELTRTT